MKSCNTFEAKIYVGLKEGYDGVVHTIKDVEDICQKYVNEIGWCVTVTSTKFIYKDGNEEGAIIGVINYPRYPNDYCLLVQRAENLANQLMLELKQHRVSMVLPMVTYMYENPEYVKKE